MNQIINIRRISYFLSYKFELNYKNWAKQLVAFIGIFTILTGFILINATKTIPSFNSLYLSFYIITLFACGYYVTSRSFFELSSTSKGFLFMQLPVSVTEKFIVAAFFSGIVFPILFTLFYAGVVDLTNWFWSLFYNFEPYRFIINQPSIMRPYKIFLFFQPFFLVGAIAFKKQHLLKSSLTIVTVFASLFALWIAISRLAYGSFNPSEPFINKIAISVTGFSGSDIIIILFMIVGWIIAFLKLKEREI